MAPEFRPPSFVQPKQYDAIPAGIDQIFETYQRSKLLKQQGLIQNAQLAAQGIDVGALQADPFAEYRRLGQDYLSKRQRESQMQDVDMRLKESEIVKNLREPKPTMSNPGPSMEGKILPPNSVMALNEGKNVARLLPDVEQALQQSEAIMGPVQGRKGSMNPYDTNAQTVDARFRTASQAFGRFMEGGVLRKEDEDKYRKMFPQLSDTPDVARNKLSIVRRMLAQKYEDDRITLGKSGYDVTGFEALSIPASIFDNPASQGSRRGESLADAVRAEKARRAAARGIGGDSNMRAAIAPGGF